MTTGHLGTKALRHLASRVEDCNDRSGTLDWDVYCVAHGKNSGDRQLEYTTSINDALKLVPDGCDWSLTGEGNPKAYFCEIWRHTGSFDAVAKAVTPALAITAAALRAMAEMSE